MTLVSLRCRVSFEADVDATCKETISFDPFSVGPQYTVPCLDMESDLKSRANFTGTIQSIDPGFGFGQKVHIQLTGESFLHALRLSSSLRHALHLC